MSQRDPVKIDSNSQITDVRGIKVSERVARAIVRDIAARDAVPGTMLEPESEMVKRYGVGRASLREALRILEVHGLITIRPGPGGGPAISAVQPEQFGQMATFFWHLEGCTFRELVDARLKFEPLMVRLAAEEPTTEISEQLQHLVEETPQVGSNDEQEYMRHAKRFHDLVLQMSGNKILNLFAGALRDIYTARKLGMTFPVEGRKAVLDEHRTIARAILQGNPQRAERLMRDHMTAFDAEVRKRFPGLLDEVIDWH